MLFRHIYVRVLTQAFCLTCFAKQFCKCRHTHQQDLHHMCKIVFCYISKNLYIRAVKNYTDLYCEMT